MTSKRLKKKKKKKTTGLGDKKKKTKVSLRNLALWVKGSTKNKIATDVTKAMMMMMMMMMMITPPPSLFKGIDRRIA